MSDADQRADFVADTLNASVSSVMRELIREAERSRLRRRAGGKRTVLLIGGSGYIGSVMTAHLLACGYAVRNLDVNIYGNDHIPLAYANNPDYRFVRGDLRDRDQVQKALDGAHDVILLAGLVGDPITKKYPELSEAINLEGVLGVLDLLDGRGLDNVIFVSTCSNYGLIEDDRLADEEYALNPLSTYAKAKIAVERHLLAKQGEVDYSATVLRFATAFGMSPRMRFDLTVNEFVRELHTGAELLVYDADTWRPYCHVHDFSLLARRVLECPSELTSFEVFNAGGDGNNATKRSIVELIASMVPGSKVRFQEKGADPRNYKVDFRKVRETLEFEPSFAIAEGVSEILTAHEAGYFARTAENPEAFGNYVIETDRF